MATIRPTGYLAHYGISEEDYLEHYGVKGMKWGKHLKAKIQNSITDRHHYKRLAEYHEDNAKKEHAISNAQNDQYKGAKRTRVEFRQREGDAEYNSDRAMDASHAEYWAERYSEGHAKNSENSKKKAKEMRDAYNSTVPGKVENAYKKGKKKINDLLKAADPGWNKARKRDTIDVPGGHKASDVVETIRNKDGSISFKKKKKS